MVSYFGRLKETGKDNILLDATMMRLYDQLKESFATLEENVSDYGELLKNFLATKIILAYYARENRMSEDPEIRVYGKIDKGVMISTANQSIKLSRPLENVAIRFERATGKMVIKQYNTAEAEAVGV